MQKLWSEIRKCLDRAYMLEIHKDLRSRYNTNYPEDVREEEHRAIELEQSKAWFHAKNLWCENRDKLSAYLRDNPTDDPDRYSTILEQIVQDEASEVLEHHLASRNNDPKT